MKHFVQFPIWKNPDPDSSFLGQNYENRDCTRVLRSNRKLRSSFHPCSM